MAEQIGSIHRSPWRECVAGVRQPGACMPMAKCVAGAGFGNTVAWPHPFYLFALEC